MNAEDMDDEHGKVADLIDRIQDVLHGQRIEHVMPALCALIGHAGYDMYGDEMSKQKFIAQVVSEVEESYETARERGTHG